MFSLLKVMTAVTVVLFSAVGVGAQTVTIGSTKFDTINAAIGALGTTFYQSISPTYTETSAARFTFGAPTGTLRFRYAAQSNAVAVRDASGTLLGRFSGETRAEAEIELKAFLTALFANDTAALQLEVGNTPTSLVAGNPASLQTRMAEASFTNGSDVGPSPNTGGSRARGTAAYNHLGLSLQTGRYTGPGFSARITSLPLSFMLPLDDPRWAVKLDAPLNFTTINGQQSLSGSLGVGLRMPIYDNWTLTPELRLGAVRNTTTGVTDILGSAALTSNLVTELRNGHKMVFGSALIYSRSFNSGARNYDLENLITKNGIEISGPLNKKLYGLPTNWETSIVYTKVGGTASYIDEWFDLSFSIGTIGSKNGVTWDSVRMGVTLTKANRGVRGININFGYEF
jgi:hypothetical protein